MISDRRSGRIAALVLFVLATGAANLPAIAPAFAQEPMMLPVNPIPLVAETASGKATFQVEIADDDGERQRGLMFRKDMPADRGLLFVFPSTRDVAFWMKDTPMPLDLVFIGEDGKVVGVLPGEPFSQDPISPGAPARFVLELKRGTADGKGLKAGVRLRHPEIDAVAGG